LPTVPMSFRSNKQRMVYSLEESNPTSCSLIQRPNFHCQQQHKQALSLSNNLPKIAITYFKLERSSEIGVGTVDHKCGGCAVSEWLCPELNSRACFAWISVTCSKTLTRRICNLVAFVVRIQRELLVGTFVAMVQLNNGSLTQTTIT